MTGAVISSIGILIMKKRRDRSTTKNVAMSLILSSSLKIPNFLKEL
jgi:hypothetical protein